MDFWEGLFLGPYWVDSNYAERRHTVFFLATGALCTFSAVFFAFFPRFGRFLAFPAGGYLLGALLLLFSLPFAAARYHRQSFLVKILLLLTYAIMYFFFWLFFLCLLNSMTVGAPGDLLMQFGERSNQLMNRFSDFFGFLGNLSANLAGIIAGALLSISLALLILFGLILLPLLYFFLIRRLQRFADRLILKKFFPERHVF